MAHEFPTSSQPRRFQGIDVSKATFDVARWGDQTFRQMHVGQWPRTRNGVKDWLASLTADELAMTAVVMESTGGYCKELAGWLREACPALHVSIANPYLVACYGRSNGLRNKTDRLDARMLADYGQSKNPPAWEPLPAIQEELRALVRTRAKLLNMAVSLRTRSREHACPSVLAGQIQEAAYRFLMEQIKAIHRGMADLCMRDKQLKHWMELLMTIPGVGMITAATILGEAGDLRRFERKGQLVAFLGVSPHVHRSGTSVNGRTRMCKVGGAHARSTLYMAAVAACRLPGPLGDFYRRLVMAGKAKLAALGALMRKLLIVMRAVLIQDGPYRPVPVTSL